MGNPFLIQACLRIPIPTSLNKDTIYNFKKEGHRIYQINVPMDLRAENWDFIARIVVTEFTVGNNKTTGKFKVVKEFSEEERKIITKTYVKY